MGLTIAQKIIKEHLISGDMTPGSEIALKIDQTLTQDATGTMAYLNLRPWAFPESERSFLLPILTITRCSLVLKMLTIIDSFSLWQRSTACTFQDRAMAFVIRCTWSALANRARL